MQRLYEHAATPFEWFPHIAAHCERVGMPWFSSVFGPESLAVLESVGCPAYKIARLDNEAESLMDKVAATGKPVIVSEAKHGESAIIAAPLLYLHCPPGYPQASFRFERAEGCNGDFGGGTFDLFDGFSFHGTDPLPCIVAATLGAKLIEAHFELDDEPSELEGDVSLGQQAFREMVDTVRKVEGMLA